MATVSIPAAELLPQIQTLYDRSLYLQAYRLAEPLGDLRYWQGPQARILAGRLANNLGAQRLGRVLHRLAVREAPDDSLARYFAARTVFVTRGPWPAWQYCRQNRDLPCADISLHAEWLALEASILCVFRDFARAEKCMEQALALAPNHPWLWVEQAHLLDSSDRRPEALAAAERSLELQPFFRPAVQSTAHYLVQLNRDRDALALLTAAVEQIESGDVLIQLASLQSELEMHEQARDTFARLTDFFPLARFTKKFNQWFAGRQSDFAYNCGDLDEALRLARLSESPFHLKVAEQLEKHRESGRKVQLAVGFVRQDHVTCAPATLTSLADYWHQPVDHRQVAQSICYDGTPGHRERHWAEENGFVAREFRVTLASAVALIDRGIPFTLTTIGPGNAHLQAVIGYDTRRGSLLVRDPGDRHVSEFLGEEMIEHFRSTGPRGMAMVPRAQAALLEGLDLPEANLYDLSHQLDRALDTHRRDEAQTLHHRMRELDPNHRLTLHCRGKLAHYDSDVLGILQTAERLLAEFPKDPNLQLTQLRCLRELGRRAERLELLETICRERPDPLFWQQFAIELLDDSRAHERARWFVRRAMYWRCQDGANYNLLADLLWSAQAKSDALELYRIGACLDDKHEGRARAYFTAARNLGQTDEALAFLRERYSRFGALSCWPARTLAAAYEQLDRAPEALQLVRQALANRPQDGDLALYAADLFARFGQWEAAQAELDRAHPIAHPTGWLRTSANICGYRGELSKALSLWQSVLEHEPLVRDANDMVARLRGDLEGESAAVAQLQSAVARFPHNLALRALLIERLAPHDPIAAETVIRETVAIDPIDPFRRELAIALTRLGRLDEALLEADLADQLDPTSPVAQQIRARIYYLLGQIPAARQAAQRALCRSVDYEPALNLLMTLCQTKAEREATLRFTIEQLVAQVIFGDGLLIFLDYAKHTLEPDEVGRILRDAHAARPDLWHAWTALVKHHVEHHNLDQALELARAATERFPLLPRVWVELAAVFHARNENESEIAALQQAQTINPTWGESARLLASAYHRQNLLPQARHELERVAAADPRDVRTLAQLAQLLWELNERDAAVEKLRAAVRLEPGFVWAWDLLREYCQELGRRADLLAEARQLTQTRPHEARSWFKLAELLSESAERPEALAALVVALVRNPRFVDAYNLRAFYLAKDGRFEEALAACQPDALEGQFPLELRSRAAQITHQQGDVPRAIELMQAVVADDPDYHWAWNRLADWYCDGNHNDDYLIAAEHLVRLAPDRAQSYGYRGDARTRLKKTAEAQADFQRSLELDPHYNYGAISLLDLFLEKKLPEEALRVLQQFGPHFDPAWRESCSVRVAVARHDRAAVEKHLQALAQCDLKERGPMHEALKAIHLGKSDASVIAVLAPIATQPQASENVILPYLEYLINANQNDRCVRLLAALLPRPEVWLSAAEYWCTEIARDEKFTAFDSFWKQNRARLAAHIRTWTAVGKVLLAQSKHRETVRWMGDWKNRRDLEPLMVTPLVIAFWQLGQPAAAAQVARAALDWPGTPSHRSRILLACSDFLSGNLPAARQTLALISPAVLGEYYTKLFTALSRLVAYYDDLKKVRYSITVTQLRADLDLATDREPLTLYLFNRLLARFAWDLGLYFRSFCIYASTNRPTAS